MGLNPLIGWAGDRGLTTALLGLGGGLVAAAGLAYRLSRRTPPAAS